MKNPYKESLEFKFDKSPLYSKLNKKTHLTDKEIGKNGVLGSEKFERMEEDDNER